MGKRGAVKDWSPFVWAVGYFVFLLTVLMLRYAYDNIQRRPNVLNPVPPVRIEPNLSHVSLIAETRGSPALRLIVLTMDRVEPLKRLLKSLRGAEYGGDAVDLDVWVDRGGNGLVSEAVLKEARGCTWVHGVKTVHVRERNVGLYDQWVHTWGLSVDGGLREDLREIALILEDDMEVCLLCIVYCNKRSESG